MSDAAVDSQEAHSTARRGHGWELVKTKNFGFLFAGQTISQIGDSLNKVALLWFVYEMTGSALKMTVVGLLQTLPPLLFGPLIGVYLDRVRKKPVMIGVDLLRTLMVLLIPVLYAMDALTLDRLYVLVFATAIFSTVFGPALTSAVPLIVAKDRLVAANALMQTTTNVGLLVGPAVSGLGIALIGAQNVLYVDAATFFFSALCLFPIQVHETLNRSRAAVNGLTSGITDDLLAGFRFVFVEQKTVLMLMLTATLYSVGISAFIFLLPVFAKEVLGVGPVQLGWLWSALGVGMLLASLSLTSVTQGDVSWRLRFMSGALAIGGLAVAALGFLDAPVAAGALIAVIGGSTAMFTPLVWTMLQELTPTHLLGRVFTSFATGGMAASMAGMAGFGWAADAIGPTTCLGGISLILLMTAASAWLFSFYKSHAQTTLVVPSRGPLAA
ncbi:MAG: MFS transporter [Nitrospira sp.]|nr:MFS transporter [Nitrospira sp.]MBS0165031.1 MFS transporter [Nitrospira sp.]